MPCHSPSPPLARRLLSYLSATPLRTTGGRAHDVNQAPQVSLAGITRRSSPRQCTHSTLGTGWTGATNATSLSAPRDYEMIIETGSPGLLELSGGTAATSIL
ncbi:hypothetical protein CPAR01_08078 [Colletotrichum paranaense]|uniref:Uncharacterized protein n=2 Tax=Colletotrichum acutatum species complex TaxID=2707335 RepID=A0AAI9Z947_9PEZI|nr:uncharacterized protein CCOS01_00480 [Colletotrichum costaricense]XP_060348717.1 uncharacterized protein CPAR01_08078 [Colletotrichum paranaense]KAK1537965.1 hypothetical protein CPAR01_08078 [Colletotrichum paranaense]KAK1539166.1 hypothetical protein CCOS01_00480 [Colletotrichum costaricense]